MRRGAWSRRCVGVGACCDPAHGLYQPLLDSILNAYPPLRVYHPKQIAFSATNLYWQLPAVNYSYVLDVPGGGCVYFVVLYTEAFLAGADEYVP